MDVTKARDQAADAIAVCAACPVRADCLEFALRHGSDVGAHGICGGLAEAERLYLRHGGWLVPPSQNSCGKCRSPLSR